MQNSIMVVIVLVSLGIFLYGYSKVKGDGEKGQKDFLALIIGLLLPLFTLLFPIIFPQEGTKILFPEVEKKIEENKKLEKEIAEKDKLISKFNLEEEKLNKKIKDLDEQNYAELIKSDLVIDGLKKDKQTPIALVNGSVYIESEAVEDIVGQKTDYDELDNRLFIGGKGEKISKEALSDDYSILYSGSNYKSVGNPNDKIEDDYTVAGKELTDGFILKSSSWSETYVLIRVDDKYSSIEFDVAKADVSKGSNIKNGKLKIELDGKETEKATVDAQVASQHLKYDISGAKTIKISMTDSTSEFAFYNVVFNKK